MSVPAVLLSRPVRARWAASGGHRDVYQLLEEDGTLAPYVLKVDRPGCRSGAGCFTEASTYQRVQERAPELLPHLATVYAQGPGWLIQERALLRASDLIPCWQVRNVCREIKAATGIDIFDIKPANLGSRLSDGATIIIDYGCTFGA